ncbi:hypothetical protein X797_002481 [Metarhizium robertsii]|uniref:Uncharacterized protein n=2 Tax=Metarhizium robertsii TaxID=568076 RepID=E9EYZ3_METRA|nr:uncharacterized protein MAA_05242 [Metarhizium robertsii ARSEF 23]EFY99184.1 hypothetical protein MAA_05242 [Metarhizium robertsii ARSEF 23]EXV04798.1 hypothetical protein X797_002481 [Metarhizium robertsii]
MLLPSATVLLLGALQPALGKPSLRRRQMDGSKNEIGAQRVTATEIAIDYLAPNPPCGGYTPWVGVWPADACNPYTADFVAWAYAERTQGRDIRTVTINLAELDAGEYKAAFVCEDGKRKPWLVSQTFKLEDEPPAKKKQGEQCIKSDECEGGFFCEHQCGGAMEEYGPGSVECLIAGNPTCTPLPKKEGESCSKHDDCDRGLYCAHQCGGRIDDYRPALCLIGGGPRCAKERQW